MGWVLFDAVKAANLHNAALISYPGKTTENLFGKNRTLPFSFAVNCF
jgi:hypothetical protein